MKELVRCCQRNKTSGDRGWLPRQGGSQRCLEEGEGFVSREGGRAPRQGEQHECRHWMVTTQSTSGTMWPEGRMGRGKWRRLQRNLEIMPWGPKGSFSLSRVYSHLVPQICWNIHLNHSFELLITHSPVTNYLLHVSGPYLRLTGSGHFLCDQHQSNRHPGNTSRTEYKLPRTEGPG